ncbi:polymer-forming cytoskeletal protein [Candidatus Auribacterota bacterium]
MKWFKTEKEKTSPEKKTAEGKKKVVCPHCDFEQEVSAKIELTFCKNCNKIINTKQLDPAGKKAKVATAEPAKRGESPSLTAKAPVKEEQVTKPASKPEKEKLSSRATPPVSIEEQLAPAPMPEPEQKKIVCSHCKTEQKVPTIALSSFCKKCGQRINLQDYEIKGKFQGELETRGIICIAEGADVTAEMNVGSAVVEGKLRGNIVAETMVELKPTGIVFGTITSPVLLVDDGAIFVGKAIVKPKKK